MDALSRLRSPSSSSMSAGDHPPGVTPALARVSAASRSRSAADALGVLLRRPKNLNVWRMVGPVRSRSSRSSSSFRLHTHAATIEPAEVPAIIRGSSPSRWSAETTPMCLTPKAAPPESSSAVRPKACRVSLMKARRCAGRDDPGATPDAMYRSAEHTWCWYSSMRSRAARCLRSQVEPSRE